MLMYTTHYKNSSCVPIAFSLQECTECTLILSTEEELCFPRTGITNIHNEQVWSDESPREIRTHSSMTDLTQAVGWNLDDFPILLARARSSDYINFLRTHLTAPL
jgi:hypothetical protein